MGNLTNPKAIKAARLNAGLTVTQAKDQSGVVRSTIYRLEKQRSPRPSLHVINTLAATYGVKPNAFFEDTQ